MTLSIALSITPPATAQILKGQWVDEAEARIQTLRQGSLRIIVLNADDTPAENVRVTITQQTHAFPLGFTATEDGWPARREDKPLWRCFNSVSLQRLARWDRLEPPADDIDPGRTDTLLDRNITAAQRQGLRIHLGPIIDGDPAANPDRLLALSRRELGKTLAEHTQAVSRRYAASCDWLELYRRDPAHRLIEQRIGGRRLHRLLQQARAFAPATPVLPGFRNATREDRVTDVIENAIDARLRLVPVDTMILDEQFSGAVLPKPLQRDLDRLQASQLRVVIVGLEVGGTSEAAAAVNLETLLITLFSHPAVDGIFLGGLTAAHARDPAAAMLGPDGSLTGVGRRFDTLFAEHWRSRLSQRTGDLGNVRTRVFAGRYQVEATLADGTGLRGQVYVPGGEETAVLLLQPDQSAR